MIYWYYSGLHAPSTLPQDSIDTVEELLKKQEDFEKTLAAQEEKFFSLNRETKVLSFMGVPRVLIVVRGGNESIQLSQ